MDRETSLKLWREIGFRLPGGGASHQLIEAFATAVEDKERYRMRDLYEIEMARLRLQHDDYVAAERERLLSMPSLMHGCDVLGAPADGEHCALLRRALTGA